jgi:hypothetical protein
MAAAQPSTAYLQAVLGVDTPSVRPSHQEKVSISNGLSSSRHLRHNNQHIVHQHHHHQQEKQHCPLQDVSERQALPFVLCYDACFTTEG